VKLAVEAIRRMRSLGEDCDEDEDKDLGDSPNSNSQHKPRNSDILMNTPQVVPPR